MTFIATAALLGAAGCGADNDGEDEQAATTAAGGQATATATTGDRGDTTTEPAIDAGEPDGQLSAKGRAVLAATQDLAADVSDTAEEFARGRIDEDEARAQLELAGERADDLRRRAQELPATGRARDRLASLNEEINRTVTDLSRLVSSGRAQSRDEIDKRIAELRREARSTFDKLSEQLDEQSQERLRKALDRIGVKAPG